MSGLINSLFEVKELILIGALILALVGTTYYIGSTDLIKARTIGNEVAYMTSINTGDKVEVAIKTPQEFDVSSVNNKILVKKKDEDLSVEKNYLGNFKISQTEDYIVIS